MGIYKDPSIDASATVAIKNTEDGVKETLYVSDISDIIKLDDNNMVNKDHFGILMHLMLLKNNFQATNVLSNSNANFQA